MTTIVGTTAAIVGLLNTAIGLVQQIRLARDRVNGSTKALQDVCTQLDSMSTTLEFVRGAPRLHAPEVETQVSTITTMMEELKSFFDGLRVEQEKSKFRKFGHAIKSGDKDDKKLSGINSRLSGARQELVLRIIVVLVGLTGNVRDGVQETQSVIMEINENVKRLGIQLRIAKPPEERRLTNAEVVTLGEEEVEVLGLRDNQTEGRREATLAGHARRAEEAVKFSWNKNTAGDNAEIEAGNFGLGESGRAATAVEAKVENSKFGHGFKLKVGNYGR